MTILALRPLGLGDLVTGLPALRLLREAFPAERLVLATPGHWAPLVARFDPSVEVLDAEELRPLQDAPRPDLAVDLHGNGVESRGVLEALSPHRLLAYADDPVAWRRAEHETARWCRLLTEGLPLPGVSWPSVSGVLGPPPELDAPRDVVVVHVGAKSASRRWPAHRFAALAMLLAGEDERVIVTGSAAESDLVLRVAAAAEVEPRCDLDLLELCALVGRARLVVSGDTGVAHLAAAYERPSVTLFGPVSPARWGPPALERHQVLWHGDDTGDPHGDTVDPHLDRITVGQVVAAAHRARHAVEDERVSS